MKYKVIAKTGVVVFECDYRRTCNSCIRQALRKRPGPERRTVRKEVS